MKRSSRPRLSQFPRSIFRIDFLPTKRNNLRKGQTCSSSQHNHFDKGKSCSSPIGSHSHRVHSRTPRMPSIADSPTLSRRNTNGGLFRSIPQRSTNGGFFARSLSQRTADGGLFSRGLHRKASISSIRQQGRRNSPPFHFTAANASMLNLQSPRELVEEEATKAFNESMWDAREFVADFVKGGWGQHWDSIAIDCSLTTQELTDLGLLTEAQGIEACRQLVRAPVINEEIGIALWKKLAAIAQECQVSSEEEEADFKVALDCHTMSPRVSSLERMKSRFWQLKQEEEQFQPTRSASCSCALCGYGISDTRHGSESDSVSNVGSSDSRFSSLLGRTRSTGFCFWRRRVTVGKAPPKPLKKLGDGFWQTEEQRRPHSR
ncbi:hypothetical protein B0T25DRAFT_611180 [Lasiosphaeria hispida]|uniref:Uncharacterized protein n=1 Tax=Lasiosphaeria hispida TaxID=260671 RepID=A0AAJ0HFT4_9PEZI|nr:hypothetical protein B0T25DRAFT_611180 [Lasiosphaeria hispida]